MSRGEKNRRVFRGDVSASSINYANSNDSKGILQKQKTNGNNKKNFEFGCKAFHIILSHNYYTKKNTQDDPINGKIYQVYEQTKTL